MTRRHRLILIFILAAIGLALALFLDSAAYHSIVSKSAERADWGRLLRVLGYWPTWLIVGTAMLMIDWPDRAPTWPRTDRWTRGVLIGLAPGLGGLFAELLKLVIRRERPELHDAASIFRPFTDRPWSTSGLGMPSSHAAVAFAAAWMLSRLHPRAIPLWLALAAGCALTRLLDRAHFLSDVYAGALVGILTAETLWRLHLRNHPRHSPSKENRAT